MVNQFDLDWHGFFSCFIWRSTHAHIYKRIDDTFSSGTKSLITQKPKKHQLSILQLFIQSFPKLHTLRHPMLQKYDSRSKNLLPIIIQMVAQAVSITLLCACVTISMKLFFVWRKLGDFVKRRCSYSFVLPISEKCIFVLKLKI